MVEAVEPVLKFDPPDEESVFIADYQRQWDFENEAKDNLLLQILRPRFNLAEHMKDSAEQTLSEVRQFKEWIRQEKARGASDAIRDAILERVQTDDNPNSWLQGPAERYLGDDRASDFNKIEEVLNEIEKLCIDRHERVRLLLS